MSRVPYVARERKKTIILGEPRIIEKRDHDEMELDARLEFIQSLIPLMNAKSTCAGTMGLADMH